MRKIMASSHVTSAQAETHVEELETWGRANLESAIKAFVKDLEAMDAIRNKEQSDFEKDKKERKHAFANEHAWIGEPGALPKAIDVFLEDLEVVETQNKKKHIFSEENKKETKQGIALLEDSLSLLDRAARRRWKVAMLRIPSDLLEPAPKRTRWQD